MISTTGDKGPLPYPIASAANPHLSGGCHLSSGRRRAAAGHFRATEASFHTNADAEHIGFALAPTRARVPIRRSRFQFGIFAPGSSGVKL